MRPDRLQQMLERVARGRLGVTAALRQLKAWPFEDLGFAKLDHHRHLRQGFPEVILAEGKTPGQIALLAHRLAVRSGRVLITRLTAKHARALRPQLKFRYVALARCGVVPDIPAPASARAGKVCVVTAGTGDIPAAEEAGLTAELLGARVERIYDVGVAGLHRLLAARPRLVGSRVVIALAGMEGALASVLAGLVDCPVIAVPTSVGYGASFRGLAALLAMINACAANVAVVNIDNGFGAGFIAGLICRGATQGGT